MIVILFQGLTESLISYKIQNICPVLTFLKHFGKYLLTLLLDKKRFSVFQVVNCFNVQWYHLNCAIVQTQQRLFDSLFGPKYEPNIFCYLDYVIIISSEFSEHVKFLNEAIDILKEAIEKCNFFQSSLTYLGFVDMVLEHTPTKLQ